MKKQNQSQSATATPRPHNQSTPTSWRQDMRQIYSADDDANIIIAEMVDESWGYADNTESKPVQYANAALIIKAVNEHAALEAVAMLLLQAREAFLNADGDKEK